MAPFNNRGSSSHHVEEEYTDYSCSTAIERLARDVETCLRSWHVDRGSDRHVSLSAATKEVSNMEQNGKRKDVAPNDEYDQRLLGYLRSLRCYERKRTVIREIFCQWSPCTSTKHRDV